MNKKVKTFCAKIGIGKIALFGRYPYMFTPLQIAKLLELAVKTKSVPGSYVEVGCAYGATTVMLMKMFQDLGLERRGYALDTFEGFVVSHAEYDIENLGRDETLKNYFKNNDISWMQATLQVANIDTVEVVKGDATVFDFDRCGSIAFALLDVDLFRPIYDILPKLYERLSPGGIIVVDDCASDPKWEGALVGYRKFIDQIGAPEEIVCGKLGLIRKSPQ